MGKLVLIRAVVFALVTVSAVLGPALSAPVAPTTFTAIDAALVDGDAAEALRLAEAALGEAGLGDGDRARLLLERGLGHHLQGDQEGALAAFTEAINAHSLTPAEQARAYLERGLILDGMDRLDDAIGDYGAALRLTPNSPTAFNNRANALRRQNNFLDAQRDYLASLAADNPAPEYPYYGLGQIAEHQGKTQEAKIFYARAVAANPNYSLAAERLAALAGALGVTETITLKPPKNAMQQPPNRGAVPADAPLVLQQPTATAPQAPTRQQRSPAVKPADDSVADVELGLRPALNDSDAQEVQLGAWRQEAEAAKGWDRAVKAADGALSGFSPHIVPVDLPGRGRYYRLRVATPDGRKLCATLTAMGLECIQARDLKAP
jgi:tetratricopeptide (TPR) repeat protein